MKPLLDVQDLSVVFDTDHGRVEAVRGVSFEINAGEFVGVVGESGCGKSVTARALIGLVDRPGRITGGTVSFDGHNLLAMSDRALQAVRGRRISMVFQDPTASLNPVFTVGKQLEQVMRAHGTPYSAALAARLLENVEIPAPSMRLRQYPHELSGGLRQRVMIAMALANAPALVIADEPTSSLDVTIEAQILDLFRRINRESQTAILLISHNLGVIAEVAENVLVFYQGKVVEHGPTRHVFARPAHPYTKALIASLPRGAQYPLVPLQGAPPSLSPPPVGCAFAPRCAYRFEACEQDPFLIEVGARHKAACWAVVSADDAAETRT